MYMYFILIRESNHCSASSRFYFQNRFVYTFTLHTACIMFVCIIWSIRVRNDDDFDEWERGNSMSVTVERKPHLCTPAGKSSVSPYNVESSRYFIYYLIIKSSSPVPCIFFFLSLNYFLSFSTSASNVNRVSYPVYLQQPSISLSAAAAEIVLQTKFLITVYFFSTVPVRNHNDQIILYTCLSVGHTVCV